MSESDSDLGQFIAMLPKLLADHVSAEQSIDDPRVLPPLRRALDESDVSNLALETVEVDHPLRWLTATVSQVAHASPSLAVALASRYTAQRLLHRHDSDLTSASIAAGVVTPVTVNDSEAFSDVVTVSQLFDPELLLLLDMTNHRGVVVDRSETTNTERLARTGLADARLQPVHITGSPRFALDPSEVSTARREWALLMSAVSLGIIESARNIAEAYAADRSQFGAALTSFAALRAMLAEIQMRAASVRALLDRALEAEHDDMVRHAELWTAAGPSAVEVALSAIQVHGGYGYIDEYPVAGLLRDAVSLRALGGPRRSAIAAVAASRLGVTT